MAAAAGALALAAPALAGLSGMQVSPFGAGLSSITTGDVNGDGVTDVVGLSQDGQIVTFLGHPNGVFGAAQISGTPVQPPSTIHLGDINGDSVLDAVVAGANGVFWVRGAGGGAFAVAQPIDPSAGPADDAAVGDFNKDGKTDVAVLSDAAARLRLYPGTGTGFFPPPTAVPVAGHRLRAADLNGDGFADFVIADHTDNTLDVVLSQAGALPAAATLYPGPPNGPADVTVADFNADGRPDIAVLSDNGGALSAWHNIGGGQFVQDDFPASGFPASGPTSIASGDFDNDGRPDVVVPDALGNNFFIFQNVSAAHGPLAFVVASTLQPGGFAGNNPRDGLADDLNGDGAPDLAFAAAGPGTAGLVTYTQNGLPDVTFDSAPSLVQTTTADFAFHSSSVGATFTCALDADPAVACTSPYHASNLTAGSHTLTVQAFDGSNASAGPSVASFTVDLSPPSNTATPSITGNVHVGYVISTDNGTWLHNPTSYTYRWQSSPNGTAWTNIVDARPDCGATAACHRVSSAEGGGFVRVVVTADNGNGTATAASVATAVPPNGLNGLLVWDQPGTGGLRQIYEQNRVAGQPPVELTNAGTNTSPAWSHAATKIAYVSTSGGGPPQIWVMNPDGSGQTKVTNEGNGATSPQWSPDDSQIAFIGGGVLKEITLLTSQVVVVNNATNLTDETWAPDGADFYVADASNQIDYINPALGAAATPVVIVNSPSPVGVPSMSIDGLSVFFGAGLPSSLYRWDVDLTGTVHLNSDAGAKEPVESPDATQLAWIHAGDVWTGALSSVTALNQISSSGGNAEHPSWGAALPLPVNTSPPVISGTAKVGYVLSPQVGAWSNSPTGFQFQWQRNGSAIAGATTPSYRVQVADAGAAITVAVKALNAAGTSVAAATSNALAIAALPANGELAWTQFNIATLKYELWVRPPGGAASRLVGAAGYEAKQPAFSPDGSRIAFTTNQSTGHDEIWIMSADGTSQSEITGDASGAQWPTWSSDGHHLAFIVGNSGSDGTGQLTLYDLQNPGAGEQPLGTLANATQAAYSPDGSTIAVVVESDPLQPYTGSSTIQLVDVSSGIASVLVGPAAGLKHPRFSADGTKLYYDVATSQNTGTLAAVRVSNGANASPPTGTAERQPVPAPDGVAGVFVHGDDIVTVPDLSQGTAQTLTSVTTNHGAADPAWAPATLQTTLVSGPSFPPPVGSGTVDVQFAAPNAPPSAVVNCFVDGEGVGPCQTSYSLLAGQMHSISAQAQNGAAIFGNVVTVDFYLPAPRGNGSIAFQSQRNGSTANVFKVASTGGTVTQLTTSSSPYLDGNPSWSPDGSKIVLHETNDGVPGDDLDVMNADGSNKTRLTTNLHAQFPAWSPDGSTIAFTAPLPTNAAITGVWTVPADGSAPPTPVAASGLGAGEAPTDFQPQWSPDGQKIVFTSSGPAAQWNIWIVGADGTGLKKLRNIDSRGPTFSPTNDSILFVSDEGGGSLRLWSMGVDGSSPAPVGSAPAGNVFDPRYSPDGTAIVYSRFDATANNYALYTANPDGSGEQEITLPNGDTFPDWGAAPPAAITDVNVDLTSSPSVGMSGSNDAIASIPLRAFDQPSTSTATVNGVPINSLPINSLPINSLPINSLPINSLPINSLPINSLPINSLPINSLPINSLPINSLGGWAAILAGTSLAGQPLQTITLQQVLALNLPALANLHLGQLDVSHSALGQMTIGALALGATPINSLGLSGDALAALRAWCNQISVATNGGTPTTNCTVTNPLAARSLFELSLAGAPINSLPINSLPINSLPINSLPINSLPINSLDVSASPINSLPINSLPINSLPINSLSLSSILAATVPGTEAPSPFRGLAISALPHAANVVNCLLSLCATATLGDAADAHALQPGATLGDVIGAAGSLTLGDLHYYGTLTIGDLEKSLPGTTELGDLIGLLLRRADVPWESLPPRALAAFDPSRPAAAFTAHFALNGSGTTSATVTVELPPGFDYVAGSAKLGDTTIGGPSSSVPDPHIAGQTLEWDLTNVIVGDDYDLTFNAYSGSDVGAVQAKETVSTGSATGSSVASLAVADSFEPNGAIGGLGAVQTLTPDQRVQQSAITSPGDVDYYRIPMPPPGARLLVHLGNLKADYDLALYADRTTSVRTAPNTGALLQDGIVGDEAVNLQGGTTSQLAPTALQDIPDPGIPVVQVSANRGTDDEDVGMVSPGGGGFATLAVFGYNGASSTAPYSLRVTTTPAPALTCDARTLPFTTGTVGAPTAVPNDVNTVILVNAKRIGDTYGGTSEHDVMTSLQSLAGDRALGVSGTVLPIDSITGVESDFTDWDQNPCDNAKPNAIANRVADAVAAMKSTHPTLKYVVFAGGDDQIPFFRLPDTERIANETGFASDFSNNEYYGALAGGNLLSDNPYLDTRPVPAGGRQLFIPDLVGGRLVETAGEITGAVTTFELNHGRLDNSSAFVSGYDFVSDGATQVQSALGSFLPSGAVSTLINSGWSKQQLLDAAFPTGASPAKINSWNGHYDNYEALAADGDHSNLLTTADLNGLYALSGGIFFTMGCHAGFQTSDVVVGASAPDALDWSQKFAQSGTGFVGNTGFGLGNTDSVAFSEELMADFAGNLGGSFSIGDALTRAKQAYYLARAAFSSYDEKTLSEAELYGLPMYGVGASPQPLNSTMAPLTLPHVRGTSGTPVLPTDGALAPLADTSAQSSSFDLTPAFEPTANTGAHGQYFTNEGQVQAPNYRPLQPFVTLPATRSLAAHGVIIDGLTSHDVTPFDPDNVRPTIDLSSNEREPQFGDEAWPEKVPTLVSLSDSNGLRQSVNLVTGQFFTDSTSHQGVERQWTHIAGRVTYSSSSDFVPPTIDQIDAFVANGAVTFTGRFRDLTESGAAGTVKLAQVVYDVDNTGNWHALALTRDPSTGAWSGGAASAGTNVQYFLVVCDDAGNCGYSSNKGRYFDAQPVQTSTGTLQLTPRTSPNSAGFYAGTVIVDASDPDAQSVQISVDGAPYTESANVQVSGDGAHTVDARGSDGTTAHTAVLIDGTAPTPTVITTPGHVRQNQPATVTVTCTDPVSGVAQCDADQDGTPLPANGALNTSSAATTINVHVRDNAGNTTTISKHLTIDADQPPSAPGAPTASSTPNRGQFMLSWAPAADPDGDPVTYTIQHKHPADASYSAIASGIGGTSYTFFSSPVSTPESEGTWTYRVLATDGTLSSAASAASAPVLVDQTPPTVTVTCPSSPVILNAVATASWTASDAGSGIAGATSGTIALATSTVGSKTASYTATDKVGFTTTGSCTYTVIWNFSGFFAPVDNAPTLNVVKPGQAVPVKFGLGGNQGSAIFQTGYPSAPAVSCSSSAQSDVIDQTVSAGSSSLQYDASTNQYTYVWKTPSSGWASGTCRQLVLKLADGTTHYTLFKAK